MGAYRDRADAGAQLATAVGERAAGWPPSAGLLVLGLARGGVPVAAPVAARLGAPLDVLTVRKIGAPGHEELAIGAVATGGAVVLNEPLIARLGLPPAAVEARTRVATAELADRSRRLRGDRPAPTVQDRAVVVVDDGLATGATMRAAIDALRTLAPAAIVVAAPVGAPDAVATIAALVDDVVCPLQPASFRAVGEWYDDFRQTTDDDVRRLL